MLAGLDLLTAFSCRLLSIHDEIAHVTLEINLGWGYPAIALRFVERAFDGGPRKIRPTTCNASLNTASSKPPACETDAQIFGEHRPCLFLGSGAISPSIRAKKQARIPGAKNRQPGAL
jgi:hypothetical protein